MGNLVTKLTTNNIELNESNVSDIVHYEVGKEKEKSPAASGQTQTRMGMLKNIFDPRSPSLFITRTPIAMFRNNSGLKFTHTNLNESVESQVDLDILTPEEQDSLDSGAAIIAVEDEDLIADPRSPITEITRTPIVAIDEAPKKKKEDNLVKKLADKLIATAISNDDENKITTEEKPIKKSKNLKNLIFEDDENCEDLDRFSTPPKKVIAVLKDARTPLSCVANTTPKNSKSRQGLQTSTPKNNKIPSNLLDENTHSASRIPVSARRLH